MEKYKYVIIGGGTAAGYAAQQFAKEGINKDELCIISSETILPMNRPPLSKQYLRDKSQDDEILINTQDFYKLHGIRVKLKTCVRSVDFGKKQVVPDQGATIRYEKLLIATGSKVRHLGVPGGELENIFYLRNIKHSDKIREKAKESKNAVIVGGGYIGSETAASLREMGLNITMVLPEGALLSKFANEEIGNYFNDLYREHGINIIYHDEAVAFIGNKSLQKVELKSGEKIDADLAVVGIGVYPNLSLFEGTALRTNSGLVVNEFCETSVKDVYAAGDVTEFPDMLFNKIRHIEHWEHAFEQGSHVARVMMGDRKPYIYLPYFFSDIFDLSYEYFGDQSTADFSITRGNIKKGDFSHWWFSRKRLVAAFIMSSRPDEERDNAREWISSRANIDQEGLGKEGNVLESLVMQMEHYSGEPRP